MSARRNFLPNHPKVVKKISSFQASPSSTFRSNHSDIRDLHSSMGSMEGQDSSEQIVARQQKVIEELKEALDKINNENYLLDQSMKFYDNDRELKELREKIEEGRREQAELILKIENCEKVEHTTTSEEYYLWQKKKKTEAFNIKINEALFENHQERQHLESTCQNYQQSIQEEKGQIFILLEEIERLKKKELSEAYTELPEVNQQEFERLKEECGNLSSTVEFMKDDIRIMQSQLEERIIPAEKNLQSTFSHYKNGLIKELQSLKKQIEDSDPVPPAGGEEVKSSDLIGEYVEKMKEMQKEIPQEMIEKVEDIVAPFDWSSFNWQEYCSPSETLKETENSYNQYLQVQKESAEMQVKMREVEEELRVVTTDTVNCIQKGSEIESAIMKILRLSTTLSSK